MGVEAGEHCCVHGDQLPGPVLGVIPSCEAMQVSNDFVAKA
jgi:hypothetical protein